MKAAFMVRDGPDMIQLFIGMAQSVLAYVGIGWIWGVIWGYMIWKAAIPLEE